MSILTEAQAKAILDKVIALSKADECTASLTGSIEGNIRFALNNVSTSGIVSNTDLAVQVAFGKRTGVATINEFDDASLERVVRRAEDLARLAPENPEFMPAVEKQTYKASPTFSESTAAITPEFRAQVAADSIGPCKAEKLIAAGFLEDGQSFVAFANSKGNFGYQKATAFNYTCTPRSVLLTMPLVETLFNAKRMLPSTEPVRDAVHSSAVDSAMTLSRMALACASVRMLMFW